jgi:para-aminobenzoate synthetase/4-amino-4-deoxychorismate lyase
VDDDGLASPLPPVRGASRSAGECLVHDAAGVGWLAFDDPVRVIEAYRLEEVVPALAEIEAAVEARGLHAVGFVSYEAAPAFDPALRVRPDKDFPLLWFALHARPRRVGQPEALAGVPELRWTPSVEPERYRRAVDRIRAHIGEGETYQANFTYRLRAPFAGDPRALFAALVRAQGDGYAAYLDTGRFVVLSASPELFLRREGRRVESVPMKGTRARAPSAEEDARVAAELAGSIKDRAENVMIVDMVRNDLGRVAEPGTVRVSRLFEVERYPTVWQMTSRVEGATGVSTAELLGALFPPASVTGAPKPRTMAILAALEDTPRRVYTGCVGFLAPGCRAQLNVAIRTVLVDRATGSAEYGVGGGIVWDSSAQAELEETHAKARILGQPRPDLALLETLRWGPATGFVLLDRHLARLARSAEYFGFPLRPDAAREVLSRLERELPPVDHRVRLLGSATGGVTVEAEPLDETRGSAPLRVALAPWPVDRRDPLLYHKTTRREVYDRARAARRGYDDVLLWNDRGELTESCVANLVIEVDGRRWTPPLACGLLPGTYRAWLLDQGLVRERILRLDDLDRAERVLLVSSVRGEREARVDRIVER